MIELILFSAFTLLLVRHRFFWVARRRKLSSKDSPLIMAHRGIKMNSPENTISSYKEAIAAGFDALELDILQTKDGELICSHNFDLERESNGIGWIQHTNYNKLKDIQTGVYTHPQNTQTIARLEDVLNEIPKKIFLNIEIKTHSLFDLSASKTFGKLFKSCEIKHSFMVSSFSPIVVAYFRLFFPKISIGYILRDISWLWITHWIHPDYLHPRADLIDNELLEMSQNHGLSLNLWTVNTIPALKRCKQKHISGIISDNPKAIHV
jgi:glycerophosphoryl diester phosphodiesterase